MQDKDETQEQLTQELVVLRQRVAELETIETKYKQVENKLSDIMSKIERAKQEWEASVDSLSELICLLDDQGHIIRANRTIEHWNLGQVVTIKGRNVQQLFDPSWQPFWLQTWQELGQGRSTEFEAKDDNLDRYFHIQVQPISTQPNRKIRDRSFAVLIIQDITERKHAEEALRQSNIQLQARNEELDAFAHTVAHDLQDPLSRIIGFANITGKHYVEMLPEELEENLQIIVQDGYKMSNIIRELLLLASVRQTEIELTPLDMAYIVNEAQQRLAHMIEAYQAEINLPDHWPIALGYAPWVEEIWANYLSNAIKYGNQPPYVKLGATPEEDGMIRFWIQDNGPGLTPEAQAQLFTPFTRLNQIRAQGHGLGLSIVQRIVDKLGGRVGVESDGKPGQGAIFSFTLPTIAIEPGFPSISGDQNAR